MLALVKSHGLSFDPDKEHSPEIVPRVGPVHVAVLRALVARGALEPDPQAAAEGWPACWRVSDAGSQPCRV